MADNKSQNVKGEPLRLSGSRSAPDYFSTDTPNYKIVKITIGKPIESSDN